jgi:hypothetical protein
VYTTCLGIPEGGGGKRMNAQGSCWRGIGRPDEAQAFWRVRLFVDQRLDWLAFLTCCGDDDISPLRPANAGMPFVSVKTTITMADMECRIATILLLMLLGRPPHREE